MKQTLVALAAAMLAFLLFGVRSGAARAPAAPVVGRWDLTVHGAGGDYPSWLEVTESGGHLGGRFVGEFGSARPVKEVIFTDDRLVVVVAPQYESRRADLRFEGRLVAGRLEGTTAGPRGNAVKWDGRRAPSLKRAAEPRWGAPITLFDGKDLAGWHAREAAQGNGWVARREALVNATPGNDLVTDRTFTDFKLHAEFNYPAESNSGIYLRGRYEFQIQDDFGQPAASDNTGGIYGFLAPRVNAARRAGEWQSCDITLVGRIVTATLNGEKILDNQEIPGITGGALDSHEEAPEPIFLQGDHGPIEYRNLILTPAQPASNG